MWQDRPAKAGARNYLFASTEFVADTSLWMPADDCLDIRLSFELGILDATSQIIAVERDKAIYRKMCASLRAIAREYRLTHQPITLNAPLDRVNVNTKLDFAFIDLCGALDVDILTWIETTLAPNLTRGADVAVTCTYAKRNSQFLQGCRDLLLQRWSKLYNGFARDHDYFDRHNDHREFEPIIVPAILLKCAFHNHDVMLRRPWPYADDMPMIAYKLSDIQARRDISVYPSFTELYTNLTLGDKPDTIAARRSVAARKAAETRRRKTA